MPDAPRFTNRELFLCAGREVGFRRRVYAGQVGSGRMSKEKAERDFALMEAIAEHSRVLADEDDKKGRLL